VRHPDIGKRQARSWAEAVVPVGWPPLAEVLEKVVSKMIQIYDCGMCSRARGVTDGDLAS
jgi:sulfur relay (sulfurtransferase) complex TusBCD TusD component (DsrE family)